MSFIKGFVIGLYLMVMFKFLGVNNTIYLSMLVGTPFLFLGLFWKQI